MIPATLALEIQRLRPVWFVAIVCLMLTYVHLLTDFIPTIESEQLPSAILPVVLTQGRLVAYAIQWLFAPISSIHPLDLMIALLGFSTAIAISIRTWAPSLGLPAYAAATVAATFPTTVHMFTFSTVNMAFGLGMMFAALSVWLFVQGRWGLSAGFIFAALGCYQGLALAIFVIYLVHAVAETLRPDARPWPTIRRGLLFLGLFVAAAMAYVITVAVVFWAFNLTLRSLGVILKPEMLLASPVYMLSLAGNFTAAMLSGADPLFLDRGRFIGALQIFILVAALGNCILRPRGAANRLLALALLCLAIIIPFASIAITGGDIRYRSLLSAPFALAGASLLAVAYYPRPVQAGIVVAGSLLSLFYAQSTVQFIRGAAISWELDNQMSSRIMERLAVTGMVIPARGGRRIPLDMVGVFERFSPWIPFLGARTSMGLSHYRYGENPEQVVGALRIMGYDYFDAIKQDKRLEIADAVRAMPSWPASGSVAMIDGVAVIKFLPNFSTYQVRSYCGTVESCITALSGAPK